ncbi:TonB family protein [uncultured Sulfitobacter sp.]|uniref:TonB family protein n=1 Tax=uncultured Sulfitobacter sp. TaxID=191468 RepID=UPI00260ED38A|nr:TonB family protein [uncultured Sulfitobacter sp.]
MIPRSLLAKLVSLVLAAGVVTGAAQFGTSKPRIEIEGGGPTAEARMGSRFEDMAVGTLTALTTDEAKVAPAEIVTAGVDAEPVQPLQTLTPSTVLTANADAATPVLTVTALTAVPALIAASPAVPSQRIVAQTPESDAPALSKRPAVKNPALAAKVAQEQERKRAERAQKHAETQKTTRGNAQRNNTKGVQSGKSKTAKAQTSGKSKKRATKAGNAAASNYPGQVMRRISRQSKPRVRSKGTAVVAFTISSGGGLARVSIARSSGSAALDKAAIGLIRKAAPFPRPPAGAQRQFSIRIKGR